MQATISIISCKSSEDFEIARSISKDYIEWLNMDLSFQNTDKEFKNFNDIYGPPHGWFIIAIANNQIAGGVGIRRFTNEICEMKRLFVYDSFQGLGIGKLLCFEIMEKAKELGYNKMYLDTVSRLINANQLYEKIGFKDIQPYYHNPDATARFMEIEIIK